VLHRHSDLVHRRTSAAVCKHRPDVIQVTRLQPLEKSNLCSVSYIFKSTEKSVITLPVFYELPAEGLSLVDCSPLCGPCRCINTNKKRQAPVDPL